MLKYIDAVVTFAEIPDEITLCINISNCPIHCKECHSKYLWEDKGEPLDLMHLTDLIDTNKGISCVCIMGGDAEPIEVDYIAEDIKEYYPGLKVAWYSGSSTISKDIMISHFDYIKIGPYIKDKGPINCPTTNQRLYKIDMVKDKVFVKDITARFWK